MAILKQSTAFTRMFLMIDSTDHITGKTGLTVTLTLSKAGGAFGAAGGSVTEVSSGWYKVALNTTDTNTLGDLAYHATSTGADATDFVDQISARIIDDLAFPATSGRSMVVDAAGLVDANVVKLGPTGSGTAQTARDVGASVLLSSGTGTGQLDFTSGVVKANLVQILATALTETAGQIAGAFKKFFNVATPTGTVNSIPDAVAGAAGGLFIAGSNAATTVNITGNLSGSVGSVTGAVGSVTGNVGGNVVGTVGNLASGAKTDVENATWDATMASHLTAGSTGAKLNAAGSAGDPWATTIPGAYGAGTAGHRLGNIPDIAAGSSGGVFIAGTNAPVVITGSGDALTLTSTGANGNGLAASGFGVGNGIYAVGGASADGDGIHAAGGGGVDIRGDITGDITGNLTGSAGSVTGNVGGNVVGSVASVTGAVGSVAGNVGGNVVGSVGSLTTNNDKTGYTLSNTGIDAVLDRSNGVETGFTLRQACRLMLSALCGKLSGGNTTAIAIRDVNDTVDRISATVDANGNRTAVTLND